MVKSSLASSHALLEKACIDYYNFALLNVCCFEHSQPFSLCFFGWSKANLAISTTSYDLSLFAFKGEWRTFLVWVASLLTLLPPRKNTVRWRSSARDFLATSSLVGFLTVHGVRPLSCFFGTCWWETPKDPGTGFCQGSTCWETSSLPLSTHRPWLLCVALSALFTKFWFCECPISLCVDAFVLRRPYSRALLSNTLLYSSLALASFLFFISSSNIELGTRLADWFDCDYSPALSASKIRDCHRPCTAHKFLQCDWLEYTIYLDKYTNAKIE